MKAVIFCFLMFTLLNSATIAQSVAMEVPDTLNGWKTTWDLRLNGSQATYSNWAQGGTNNIAANSRTIFTTMRKVNRFAYVFQLEARYGGARLSGKGLRKMDDRLFIRNRFLYDVQKEDTIFKLFSNFTVRTQFDKGFDYDANEDGSDKLISRFMAPGTFNQNAGIAYVPNEHFTLEAGLGLQQKVIRDVTLRPIHGFDPDQRFKSEAGFNIGSNFEIEVGTNLEIKSNLSTFTNILESVRSTDIHFSNKLDGKINSYMHASLNIDLIYDDDFSNEVQFAQVVSLGVSYTLR